MDDWLVLLFLPAVGEALGLGSLELRSATPFTSSPASPPSWMTIREHYRRKTFAPQTGELTWFKTSSFDSVVFVFIV